MRIAIFSDIHANLEALTVALQHIEKEKPDTIICLGDIIGYGANPNECIELVRTYCDTVLLGNHDAALLDTSITSFFNPLARIAIQWTLRVMTSESIDFLRSLPLTSQLGDLFFVHASPTRPESWNYIVDANDAREHFASFHQQICFVGHSHVPGIYSRDGEERAIHQGKRYVINVGSIGQPRDCDPRLSYGFFDTEDWSYHAVRLVYPIERAAKKILESGLPSALAYRLFKGQ